MEKIVSNYVVLCDGEFPNHPVALGCLKSAKQIICCDGAADKLIEFGLEPSYIVGDLDSVSESVKKKYSDRLYEDLDQEINDQTKAVNFAIDKGANKIVILGATGKREDHTLGNISLLLDYKKKIDVLTVSNNGVFIPVLTSATFNSEIGQQISIFSLGIPSPLTSENLKYPIKNRVLQSWWMGTLNEATGKSFSLEFEQGKFIVFKKFMN